MQALTVQLQETNQYTNTLAGRMEHQASDFLEFRIQTANQFKQVSNRNQSANNEWDDELRNRNEIASKSYEYSDLEQMNVENSQVSPNTMQNHSKSQFVNYQSKIAQRVSQWKI
jgi:hypothetical protein